MTPLQEPLHPHTPPALPPLLQPLERIEPPAKGADVMGEEWAPAYERSWPILIVCPPTLIDNWHRELSEWGRFKWGAVLRCVTLPVLHRSDGGNDRHLVVGSAAPRHATHTPHASRRPRPRPRPRPPSSPHARRVALCTSGRADSAVAAVLTGKAEIMLIGYEMLMCASSLPAAVGGGVGGWGERVGFGSGSK